MAALQAARSAVHSTLAPMALRRARRRTGSVVEQFEVDLALGEIDAGESNLNRVAHLPAPPRGSADQSHAARLKLPKVSRYRRDVHQPVDRHLLQQHEHAEFERAGDRGLEALADPGLHVQALEIAHHVARGVVGAPLALRTLGAERLKLRGAVAVSGG